MILSTNAVVEPPDEFDPLALLPGNLGIDSMFWWWDYSIEENGISYYWCGEIWTDEE